MPNFNSVHDIAEAIHSVRAENYPDFEQRLIDGGSNDAAVDLVEKFPHLTRVRNEMKGIATR